MQRKEGIFFSLLRKETNTPNELILVSSCAGCALPGDFAGGCSVTSHQEHREDGKGGWEAVSQLGVPREAQPTALQHTQGFMSGREGVRGTYVAGKNS